MIVFLSPIAQHIWMAQAVWNPTAIANMAVHILVAVFGHISDINYSKQKARFHLTDTSSGQG